MRNPNLDEVIREALGPRTNDSDFWIIVSEYSGKWKFEMSTPSAVNSVVALNGLAAFYVGRKLYRVKCTGNSYRVIDENWEKRSH